MTQLVAEGSKSRICLLVVSVHEIIIQGRSQTRRGRERFYMQWKGAHSRGEKSCKEVEENHEIGWVCEEVEGGGETRRDVIEACQTQTQTRRTQISGIMNELLILR